MLSWQGLLGDRASTAIPAMVESASDTGEGVIASAVGVVLLAIGATTVFAELQTDLGFVLLVSLVVSAMLSTLGS
jgi:hypothetical protein